MLCSVLPFPACKFPSCLFQVYFVFLSEATGYCRGHYNDFCLLRLPTGDDSLCLTPNYLFPNRWTSSWKSFAAFVSPFMTTFTEEKILAGWISAGCRTTWGFTAQEYWLTLLPRPTVQKLRSGGDMRSFCKFWCCCYCFQHAGSWPSALCIVILSPFYS